VGEDPRDLIESPALECFFYHRSKVHNDLTGRCKYNDCIHTIEACCAVLKALEGEEISEEMYNNYMKISIESQYNEMSYAEK